MPKRPEKQLTVTNAEPLPPEIMDLVANVTSMSLARGLSRMGDGTLDIDKECRYPDLESISAEIYREMYDKFGVAERVVNILPDESWGISPKVYEDESEDVETPFEKRMKHLSEKLNGDSWHRDENTNPVWEYLRRVDQLSGVAHYGVLLLGLGIKNDDDWTKPLPGFTDNGFEGKLATSDKDLVDLLYLQAFDASLAEINSLNQNKNVARYGMPISYNITFNDPHYPFFGTGGEATKMGVHWSRVIHICDNRRTSNVYGVPRQKPVYFHLLDLRKLYGGSAEMYWQGAFPGLSFETHPQLGNTVKIDATAMKEQVLAYYNGLQRYLALTGAAAKPLSPQVVDPTQQIERQLDAICIKLGVPKRIFIGSERGELASSQDKDTWEDRLNDRRQTYLNPWVIRPFFDRLIQCKVLPPPEKGYVIDWGGKAELTPMEKATLATQKMQAVASYIQAGADVLIPPKPFLVSFLDFDPEEAEELLEEADEIQVEKEEEAAAQQEAQAEAMAQMQPPQGPPQDAGGPPKPGAGKVPPQPPKKPTLPPGNPKEAPTTNQFDFS